MKWPCVCCGFFTLPAPTGSGDEICAVCFWQDDAVDNEGTEVIGPNKVTLPVARQNFAALGSSEARLRALVRPAREDEKPPAPPASV